MHYLLDQRVIALAQVEQLEQRHNVAQRQLLEDKVSY